MTCDCMQSNANSPIALTTQATTALLMHNYNPNRVQFSEAAVEIPEKNNIGPNNNGSSQGKNMVRGRVMG